MRGDGAYVVAPGSIHESGVIYTGTLPALNGHGDALMSVPEGVAKLLRATRKPDVAPAVDGPIPAGSRNDTLTSFAGSMRRRGMSESGILAALRVENLGREKSVVLLLDRSQSMIGQAIVDASAALKKAHDGRGAGELGLAAAVSTPALAVHSPIPLDRVRFDSSPTLAACHHVPVAHWRCGDRSFEGARPSRQVC